MQEYQCHKKVKAAKIISVQLVEDGALLDIGADGTVKVDTHFMQKHTPEAGGYLVEYDGGAYTSYSPAAAFEAGYTPTSEMLDGEEGAIMVAMAGGALVGLLSAGAPGSEAELARKATNHAKALLTETKKYVVK